MFCCFPLNLTQTKTRYTTIHCENIPNLVHVEPILQYVLFVRLEREQLSYALFYCIHQGLYQVIIDCFPISKTFFKS